MARITRSSVKKNTTLSSLPNPSPSRRRVQRPQAAAAGPKRQPPKKQHSYRSQGTQTDLPVLKNTQDAPTVLSTGDRVDSIVAQLQDFRWSFATFIEHYVTASSSSSSTGTPDRRAKRLWKAIFENPIVEQRLLLHGGRQLGRLHQEPLCRQIKWELEALTYYYASWGRIALAQSNGEEPVEELTIDKIIAESQRIAPTLRGFLTAITQPRPYANPYDLAP